MSTLRIDHTVTSGTFTLDGETFDVDNNVWIIGDDQECFVIDAPHDVSKILTVIAGRRVKAILCTHAHDDHVRVAPELAEATGAPIWLHPDDQPLWHQSHPKRSWDEDLGDGDILSIGNEEVHVLHTPGHSPGGVSLYCPSLQAVFTGDTLFKGGPGSTGRSFSDHDMIITSIRGRLFALPPETSVHTGHGDNTTIGAEEQNVSYS